MIDAQELAKKIGIDLYWENGNIFDSSKADMLKDILCEYVDDYEPNAREESLPSEEPEQEAVDTGDE